MKKWYTTAAAALTLAATVTAFAVSPPEGTVSERIAKMHKKERPARQGETTPRAPQAKAPIKSGDKQLYGVGSEAYDGVFSYNPGPAELHNDGNHVRISSKQMPMTAGCYFEGRFLAFYNNIGTASKCVSVVSYDAETWAEGVSLNFTGETITYLPVDVTFDPATRKIYGVFMENAKEPFTSPLYLGYIDPDNVDWNGPNRIAELDNEVRGLAADATGQLYAVSNDSHIYKVNKNTGEFTDPVRYTLPQGDGWGDPYAPFARGYDSAEIDYDTNQIYFSYNDGEADGFIVKIDPANGNVTMLYNSGYWSGGNEYSEMISALWFKQKVERSGTTPASPTELSVTPKGITLDATVGFKLPDQDVNGNTLQGNVDWVVSDGVNDLQHGSDPAGTVKSVDVSVENAGMARFLITAQVGENKSATAIVNAFIGPDTPQLLDNPTAMADGNTVTIFWDEAYPEHNGNLGELTYRVTRAPGDVVVAEATPETSVTDIIDSNIKTLYTYTVTPIAAGQEGTPKSGRPIFVGEYLPLPYADDFTDELMFAQYPIVDANKDLNTWYINAQRGRAIYPSNSNPADDYLLIGPFLLEAGHSYNFEMTADGHSVPEKVAAYVTTSTQISDDNLTEIIPETACNPSIRVEKLNGSFVPAESGRHYFAVKACSNPNSQNLYIYDVKVSGTSPLSPAEPSEIEGLGGESDYTLKCVLPATTLDGSAPADITSVVIYRDNQKLDEVTENVADGQPFSYTDAEEAADGEHIYRIAAINAAGEGLAARHTGWRGPDTPEPPGNLRIWEDIDDPTILHFSMDAPKRGVHGGYINPDELTYYVDYLSLQIGSGVVKGGTTPDFSLRLNNDQVAKPALMACSVYAENRHGNSGRAGWNTKSVHIGPANPLPLRESFPNGSYKSGIWSGEAIDWRPNEFEALWDCSMGTESGISSQDSDGYMMSLHTYYENSGYRLLMPRVSVAQAENPTLVFYYRYGEEAREFNLEVIVDDQPIAILRQFDLQASTINKWIRQEISLSQYKSNKYIQLAVSGRAEAIATDVISIDNISIIDLKEKDLSLISGEAPLKMIPNEDIGVTVNLRNSGRTAVSSSDYEIVMTLDDREVVRRAGLDLDLDQATACVLAYTPQVTDPETGVFKVRVEYADDMNKADNEWSSETVRLSLPDYPAPRALKASPVDGVTLEWTAPDKSEMPAEQVTETFDEREAFSISDFGDFTLYDGDKAPTVMMATALGVLNYPHIGEPMAWQIMDPGAAGIINGAWYARSGEQFAVSFQACISGTREKASNDWLISPELNGEAQKISFFARAGMSAYAPELIDIKYSTGGNTPDDFQDLATDIEVPYASDWIEFEYRLPAGTKYFAIVHKSFDKLALLLDDVTYSPAGSLAPEFTLEGYNIYRDGVRINDQLVSGERYVDTTTEEGKEYGYHVSAVWSVGESRVSNLATVAAGAGVANVTADASSIKILAGHSSVRVIGAEGLDIRVVTPSGATVTAVRANGPAIELPVAPGIYVVTAGKTAAKVMVR